MAATKHVFVYGTLRPPRPHTSTEDSCYYPRIAPYVRAVVPARLPGAEIYDLGPYPAARPGNGVVQGDLLTVEPLALGVMDDLEGHPTFYRRARVRVHLETGSTDAWVYWAPKKIVADAARIASGDWFRRSEEDIEPAQQHKFPQEHTFV